MALYSIPSGTTKNLAPAFLTPTCQAEEHASICEVTPLIWQITDKSVLNTCVEPARPKPGQVFHLSRHCFLHEKACDSTVSSDALDAGTKVELREVQIAARKSTWRAVSGLDLYEIFCQMCGQCNFAVWGLIRAKEVEQGVRDCGWALLYDETCGFELLVTGAQAAKYQAPDVLVQPISNFMTKTLTLLVSYLSALWILLEHMRAWFGWRSFLLMAACLLAMHALVLRERSRSFLLGLDYEEVLESGQLLRLGNGQAWSFNMFLALLALIASMLVVNTPLQLASLPAGVTFSLFLALHVESMLSAMSSLESWRAPQMERSQFLCVDTKQLGITDEGPLQLSKSRAFRWLVVHSILLFTLAVSLLVANLLMFFLNWSVCLHAGPCLLRRQAP